MVDGPPTFLVAAEDRSGYEAVVILVDRLLVDGISWVDGNLEHYRTWFKASTDKPWLSITAAKKSWPGIRPRGHFRGEKGAPDAANTRYVLLSAAKMHFSVALSVLSSPAILTINRSVGWACSKLSMKSSGRFVW